MGADILHVTNNIDTGWLIENERFTNRWYSGASGSKDTRVGICFDAASQLSYNTAVGDDTATDLSSLFQCRTERRNSVKYDLAMG